REDVDRGQTPVAFVILRAGAPADAEALTAWAEEHMAGYKVPEFVFVEAMPMTATGKIRKTVLLEELVGGEVAPPRAPPRRSESSSPTAVRLQCASSVLHSRWVCERAPCNQPLRPPSADQQACTPRSPTRSSLSRGREPRPILTPRRSCRRQLRRTARWSIPGTASSPNRPDWPEPATRQEWPGSARTLTRSRFSATRTPPASAPRISEYRPRPRPVCLASTTVRAPGRQRRCGISSSPTRQASSSRPWPVGADAGSASSRLPPRSRAPCAPAPPKRQRASATTGSSPRL